jgi:hypothetical protein
LFQNQVEFYVPPASARRRREAGMEGTSMRDIVLGHMVPGLYDMSEFLYEQVRTDINLWIVLELIHFSGTTHISCTDIHTFIATLLYCSGFTFMESVTILCTHTANRKAVSVDLDIITLLESFCHTQVKIYWWN